VENSVVVFKLVADLIIGLVILNLCMNVPQIEALHWCGEFGHLVSQVVLCCHWNIMISLISICWFVHL